MEDLLDQAFQAIDDYCQLLENENNFYFNREQSEHLYSRSHIERMRVNDWCFRVGYELRQHEQNCILTLTYDNEHLPANGSLDKRDYQLFMKMLRAYLAPQKIRYFGCGEYGSKGLRPHYHFIIFGYCPSDLEYSHSDDKHIKFYRSKTIANLWKRGFVVVCSTVDINTVPYVCKYMQKFNRIPKGLVQPFLSMSRRPGIGFCGLDSDFLDIGHDKMYNQGRTFRLCRYYLKKLKEDGIDITPILDKRQSLYRFAVPFEQHERDVKRFKNFSKIT